MELRRALLLFAVVLGIAAVVTSLSSTAPDRQGTAPTTGPSRPTARPAGRRVPPLSVRFDSARAPQTRRATVGQATSVSVRVDQAGTVTLAGLGLTATAEPLTPARFDVLPSEPGDHLVRLAPADGAEERTLGRLVIRRSP